MFERTDAHISTWVIAIILFIVAVFLHKSGKEKAMKIVQMILRVFYLLIIATGVLLFSKFSSIDPALYGVKFLFGVIVIAMMEMVLIRTKLGKKTGVFWTILVIAFVVTFYIGARLPLGWNWFAA
ncbi:YisL family protein [Lederbergia sp. NSJ-179]|uniref:YisL family protein n=1 Tax=Lederbergia sp. NSJ-179 TaxID=2931402 RepID=UPI001FD0E87E|nr:YisL family protein [Lederbergia sp. NSJ-179]MCJ7840379.1 YisL family protein [Lederbergia sp. NSJ-179]